MKRWKVAESDTTSWVVSNLRNELKDTRKKANAFNSANTKLKLLRQADKKLLKAERSDWPLSKQTKQVQALITGCHMDTVKAMEATDELQDVSKSLRLQNMDLMSKLKLTEMKLQEAMQTCYNTNVTNWVEKLGKRGTHYDAYIVEMGLQLMASQMSAAQAVYAVTIFMLKTYPKLKAGKDYRMPGESTFKEWAEAIYEVSALVGILVSVAYSIYSMVG